VASSLFLSKRASHEEIAAALATHLKGAGSGVGEVVAAIEADGALVVGIGAQEETAAAHGLRLGDSGIHQGLSGVKVRNGVPGVVDHRSGTARTEAREEIDSFELDVVRLDVETGKIGLAKHGVTHGSSAGDGFCERDARVRLRERGAVGLSGVVLRAMRDDIGAGKHPGERFEKGSSADESECGCVVNGGEAKAEEFDGGFFGRNDPGSFSEITGHKDFHVPMEVRW